MNSRSALESVWKKSVWSEEVDPDMSELIIQQYILSLFSFNVDPILINLKKKEGYSAVIVFATQLLVLVHDCSPAVFVDFSTSSTIWPIVG